MPRNVSVMEPLVHQEKQSATEQPEGQGQPKKIAFLKSIQKRLKKLHRRRVPQVRQMNAIECGPACLAMILRYHGRQIGISEIRERCGAGRDGLSAQSIVKVARSYGMRVRAVSLKENDFRYITLPAIIHWEFNHFLVVERWTPKWVDVVDPAVGRRRISAEEFDAGFTGIVIMMEPGAQFTRQSSVPQTTLFSFIKKYSRTAPITVVQVIGATLILQLVGLVLPVLTKVIVDQVLPFKMSNVLFLIGIGLIIILLSQLVITLLRASLLIYLQAKIDSQMMTNSFEHLLSLPQFFFQVHSSGDILARLESNLVIRDMLSSRLISTILDGSLVIVYLVILLSQSLAIGILVLVIASLQVMLLLFSNPPMRRLGTRELEAVGKTQGYVTEALTGITTLKAAGAEDRVFEKWANLFFQQLNISLQRNYVSNLIDTALGGLRALSPLILLWMGTSMVLNGQMQLGTMLALNALAGAFLTPVGSLVSTGQQVQMVRSHLERIADIVEAEPEQDVQRSQRPPQLRGRVKMEHVSFRYDPQSPLVLKDISLDIEPGQKIALVGRTGSGKSTLGKLLLGLYLPTEGQILFDGISLRLLNYKEVRAQFGVVMQDSNIFSGSIRENISFHDPEVSMDQIVQAAQAAALHEDIIGMPMAYETFVSEGGSMLSGGQCQRLAIARALAHSPAILLMDEATSSLDVVTERIVEKNLRDLACTQIIIAHRLSTIRNADLILVLEQGVIVERGSHDELLARNGYYAELIRNQLGSNEMKVY